MKTVKRFTASWCAPCKGLAMMLNSVETTTPIEIIDIDEQGDVAREFNVRGVPTLVMLEDGKEVKRWSGMFASATALQEWLEG